MDPKPVEGALLGYLDAADRDHLVALGPVRKFAAGEMLMHQGDPTDHVLVLVAGWVRVYSTSQDGQETAIALRGPGDVLGELAALHGWHRTVSIQALEPVRTVQLLQQQFVDCLSARPGIAIALVKQMSIRLREAETTLLDLATLDVSRRVAAYLLRMSRRHGKPGAEGLTLDLPLTQQDIANRVSASLRGVTRAMALLRERGVVITTRKHIVIVLPEVLRSFVGYTPNDV